ncbi:unnamed protein product [Ceutorhynchus assimilis]|uniref:EGF-like domain-containing protein n=1 Tax=Ceutorhynchus assimilis TaxID=467358 RepID=A0A9N9MSV2_9CUCU|nr:unnamed protein product [Ceutorhynchus assimilis]
MGERKLEIWRGNLIEIMFSTVLLLAGTVVCTGAFLDSFSLFNLNNCSSTDFHCSNSRCIANHARCDGSNDCGDFSDEKDCEMMLCKEPHYFRCKNQRCISKAFVCDDENDCEDFSDEINCEHFKTDHILLNSTCAAGEWQCTDKICIPEDWVCNQEVDCLDGSDEGVGCTLKEKNCDGFRCNNKRCVPNEWRCDGHDDCSDNSDEMDCEHHFDLKDCTLDKKMFLCLDGKACVDFKKVCNNRNDCLDKSDEGGLCGNSALTCSSHNCTHDCVQLPTGPKCLCPIGYHNIDEKSCQDINECEEYGICDQKCINKDGSYECYCDHKYVLQDDKKTCKAVGGEATMIFTSKTQIRSYLLTSNLLFPIARDLKQVVGISSDGHHIYWTDVHAEHESIVRALEDGSDREILVTSGLGLPEDLKVDWLTGNIYFTDADKQHIGVCKSDGSHCAVLINTDIRKPRAIVLNVDDGTMFWSDWAKPSEIATAQMDGTSSRPFLRDDIHWPNGLALDYPNSRLYWTDAKKMTLESILLDGTDRRVILQDIVKHPFAIGVFENRLYWSDWETHSIDSCDKFTGKNHHTLIKEHKDFIYGLSIYHSVEHKTLGKHAVTALKSVVDDAGALTYDSTNHSIFISDLASGKIMEFNLHTQESHELPLKGLGKVMSMDYDPTGNNLYICDYSKSTLEVISLTTMAQKVLIHDADNETPQFVSVVPQEGVMFVSFYDKIKEQSHIDRMAMDATGRTHIVERGLVGPVALHYDAHYHRLFFADAATGDIEHTNVDGDERHLFKSAHTTISDLTTLDADLFWTNAFSRKLYWADKSSGSNSQKITLDIPSHPGTVDRVHVASVTPQVHVSSPCQHNNGNCSHICLSARKTVVCACPARMTLASDNKLCLHRNECDTHEFLCPLSNVCILGTLKCNGKTDCPLGEDEEDCRKSVQCPLGFFGCGDGQCIPEKDVCDHKYDCQDKSDEHQCNGKHCPPNHFTCGDGSCVADRFVCDGMADCTDRSDESNCLTSTCDSSQFRCDSGECIPRTWECDHDYDCRDLSDEHSECVAATCAAHMFTCDNGKCIDQSLVCDQSNDCGDRSDESQCFLPVDTHRCQEDEFSCTNQSICLSQEAKCNGTAECPMGEDERGCSTCGLESFECANKKCISDLWVCDGSDDCGDHSDENATLCESRVHKPMGQSRFSHLPCDDGFRCKSGACIPLELLCNNKHDCFDESDEGGLCSKSCDAINNPCDQECIRTPSGPMCRCKPGYRLMGDGHTCKDINECEQDPPVCSQLCQDREGGFTCDCYQGFILRSDKKSCKSIGEPMSVMYTLDNQIREISQKTNSLKILYSEEMPKITDLEVAVRENSILFTIENSPTLQKINTNTMKRQYIEHIGYPRKIAYDWSTGHIYYYNALSDDKSISVCSFEAMACAKLIDVDIHLHVSELTVDSVNRVLFYSLTSWWVFNVPSYVLYKANLDGTGVTEIVKSTHGFISGLSYDLNKKQVYYADQHQGQILKISYEGKQKTTLFSNLTHPSSLKFFENTLYFATSNGDISKCLLYGTRLCETFQISAHSYGLFTLVQEGLQPPLENPCKNSSCHFMCVASSSRYKCLCEDGSIVGEKEKCSNKYKTNSGKPIEFHSVDSKSDGDSATSKTVLSILLISVCLILVGFGLVTYARKRQGADRFHLRMRFINPIYKRNAADGLEKPILMPGEHEYTNPALMDRMKDDEIDGQKNSTALIEV